MALNRSACEMTRYCEQFRDTFANDFYGFDWNHLQLGSHEIYLLFEIATLFLSLVNENKIICLKCFWQNQNVHLFWLIAQLRWVIEWLSLRASENQQRKQFSKISSGERIDLSLCTVTEDRDYADRYPLSGRMKKNKKSAITIEWIQS